MLILGKSGEVVLGFILAVEKTVWEGLKGTNFGCRPSFVLIVSLLQLGRGGGGELKASEAVIL